MQYLKKNLEKFIGSNIFTDVTFQLDDGRLKAHRAMLISRCDMMRAMLNGDFREAHANTVRFEFVLNFARNARTIKYSCSVDHFSGSDEIFISQAFVLFIHR